MNASCTRNGRNTKSECNFSLFKEHSDEEILKAYSMCFSVNAVLFLAYIDIRYNYQHSYYAGLSPSGGWGVGQLVDSDDDNFSVVSNC